MKFLKALVAGAVLAVGISGIAHSDITSFTGQSDSTLMTNTSTQTKKGGFNVLGNFQVGGTTGTTKITLFGNTDIYGNLRVFGVITGSSITVPGFNFSGSTETGGVLNFGQVFLQATSPYMTLEKLTPGNISSMTHVVAFELHRSSQQGALDSYLQIVAYSTGMPVGFRIANQFSGAASSAPIAIGYCSGNNCTDVLTISATNQVVVLSTFTAPIIRFSTMVARGIAYNMPPADGSNGDVLTTNGGGGLTWTTPSAGGGGGGAPAFSTQCIQLSMAREVYLASSTNFPIPAMSYVVRNATFNIISLDSFVEYGSTRPVGWMGWRLGIATSTTQDFITNSTATYMTGDLHISSTNKYGMHIATSIPVPQDQAFFVGITTIQSSGIQPSGLHCDICGWFNARANWP